MVTSAFGILKGKTLEAPGVGTQLESDLLLKSLKKVKITMEGGRGYFHTSLLWISLEPLNGALFPFEIRQIQI